MNTSKNIEDPRLDPINKLYYEIDHGFIRAKVFLYANWLQWHFIIWMNYFDSTCHLVIGKDTNFNYESPRQVFVMGIYRLGSLSNISVFDTS